MSLREATTGEVTYNGFTFPGPFHCQVRSTPIYDSADRARKYNQYTIIIECIILPDDAPTSTPGAQTDTNLTNIRKRLQAPYKPLTFEDQGFGPITVDGTTVVDSRFGPKPRLLAMESVGSNRACRISWQCEVTIPECSSGTSQYTNALAELTFQSSWNINEHGMTVRTMRGTIEVPFSIANGIAQDTIDNYRNTFNPPELPNFWRSRHYDESRGKNILEITIIDTEVPSDNPFFPGCVKADIRHRVSSNYVASGFVKWDNTLSGTIEAVPGYSKNTLWNWFFIIFQSRRNKVGNAPVVIKGHADKPRKPFVLMQDIEVEESLFTRSLSFRMSWQVIGLDIRTFMERNGMFTPVPGTNWTQWKTELSKVTGFRGLAGLKTDKSSDLIIDLCSTDSISLLDNSNTVTPAESYNVFETDSEPAYVAFESRFAIRNDYQTATHYKRGEATEGEVTSTSLTDTDALILKSLSADIDFMAYYNIPKTQLLGPTKTTIVFYGYAERLNAYPVLPKVISFRGQKVYNNVEQNTPYVKHASASHPTYGLKWYISFDVPTIAGGDWKNDIVTSGMPENYIGK